jgi:hypothetical protein
VENDVKTRKHYWVTESVVKLRFDLQRTPLRFFRKLGTSFWGLRAGSW